MIIYRGAVRQAYALVMAAMFGAVVWVLNTGGSTLAALDRFFARMRTNALLYFVVTPWLVNIDAAHAGDAGSRFRWSATAMCCIRPGGGWGLRGGAATTLGLINLQLAHAMSRTRPRSRVVRGGHDIAKLLRSSQIADDTKLA